MNTKKLANELISKYGFNCFMVLHILRYSREEKISIHEIFKILKENSVEPNYVGFISWGGYQSFKRLISELKNKGGKNGNKHSV